MGAVSRLIVESLPFGTTVEEYQVRFRQVVPPDQPLTVTAEVVQSENERLTVAIQCTLEPDQLAISGRMVLRTPSTRAEPDHPIP
jgi:acyl-CoA thioesterase FadM